MKTQIIFLLFIISVSFATSIKLPWKLQQGKYSVGVKQQVFQDHSRTDVLKEMQKVETGCADGSYRQLPVQIYYPIDKQEENNGKQANYIPEALLEAFLPPQFDLISRITKKYSYKFTNLSTEQDKFPVVFFSPGFGVPDQFYTAITETLASYGYIVFSISHPYANGSTYNPENDCTVSEIELKAAQTKEDLEQMGQIVTKSAIEVVKDLEFLFKEVVAMNQNNQSQFFQKLDLENFASMGHSLGGIAATMFCQKEENYCKSNINLDGGSIIDYQNPASMEGSWPFNKKELQFLKFSAPRFILYVDDIPQESYGERQFYIRNLNIAHDTYSGDMAYFPVNQKDMGMVDPNISVNNIILNINNFLKYSFEGLEAFEWIYSEEMESTLQSKNGLEDKPSQKKSFLNLFN